MPISVILKDIDNENIMIRIVINTPDLRRFLNGENLIVVFGIDIHLIYLKCCKQVDRFARVLLKKNLFI